MLRYAVQDMTCGHCVQTITQALTELDPHAGVVIDLAAKTVDVTTQASPEAVATVIGEAGYTPVRMGETVAPGAKASCCGHC